MAVSDALEPHDLDATVRDAHAREPLRETSALGWRLAPELCWRDEETGRSCRFYHRVWGTMRNLGVTSSLRSDSRFLLGWLRHWAREGRRRVLIPGAADAGMLCHVLAAYGAEGVEPDVTVVDRCPTSIAANRLCAEREGVKLELRLGDVLEFTDESGFDVIATHNFYTFVAATDRIRLAELWGRLLRRGGGLVTAQRVRPQNEGPVSVCSPEEAEALAGRVLEAARRYAGELPAPPEAIAKAAHAYARQKTRTRFQLPEEMTGPLAAAGLETLHAAPADAAARRIDRPMVPLRPEMYRLWVVARRPGSA